MLVEKLLEHRDNIPFAVLKNIAPTINLCIGITHKVNLNVGVIGLSLRKHRADFMIDLSLYAESIVEACG